MHLSSSEKTAPRRQERKSGYIQVCNKGSRQSEHQRSGIRVRNLAFYVWEDASLWAHRIHSFHMHFSYLRPILFPWSPCFLHSSSFSSYIGLAPHQSSGGVCRITVWGTFIHIWRPEITDGWQFLFIDTAGDIFVSQNCPCCPVGGINTELKLELCLVKAMAFPVVMYGCESCPIKKAECRRIDVSELWSWRRLLRESLGLQDQTSLS